LYVIINYLNTSNNTAAKTSNLGRFFFPLSSVKLTALSQNQNTQLRNVGILLNNELGRMLEELNFFLI